MAKTVNAAFDEFLSNRVNLDPVATARARSSRDWLVQQIALIPNRSDEFPRLYPDIDIHYGSFARRTKIRELDDLDMIIGIMALGTTYLDFGGKVELTVPDGIALRGLCHEGTNLLNSRRVINLFASYLASIPQYANSEIKRNGSAAVLNLTSYTWSFDIVPGFFTTPEMDGRTFYIIPNGQGHWMKTDPRIDHDRISNVNQLHGGKVLNPLRLMKYWNRRATMPSMQSYLIECIVLNYYQHVSGSASSYVDVEVAPLLSYISKAVLSAVTDPKRIQGDINLLNWEERNAISSRANLDEKRALAARAAETAGDHRGSINAWRDIFGSDFPQYG